MDIIILILIVFFAVSVTIVAIVIIDRLKRQRELRKKEEARKEQEELAKKAAEDSRKLAEVEAKAKKEADAKDHKEAELITKKAEDEAKELDITGKITAEGKTAEEKLKKEREDKSLREEEERLKNIRAEEEKIDREAREKASKERAEQEVKARKEEANKKEELERYLKEEKKAKLEEIKEREEEEKQELAKRLPPGERGGRPRGTAEQESSKEPSPEPKPRSLKPEIICWNKGWEWIVGIEVPEEFASPQVTQNNESLKQDTSNESNYHLRHIEGTVKVAWTEGEKNIPIMEQGRNYLIFKMRRGWKGLGRLVRRPTAGYYLIVAPQEWNRHDEISGPAPVAPENVRINGYKAHFFVLGQNEDTAIAFINAKGERIQVETGSSRFRLVGKEISDSSEDMGPLFGEELPLIKTNDEREWGNVGVVVVGEEGSGRNRWRTQFVPQEGANEQRMPDELTNRQGGWYFVRIYDNNDDLLESMDFRFIAGLKDIQIMNSKCLLNQTDIMMLQFNSFIKSIAKSNLWMRRCIMHRRTTPQL